MNCLSLLPHGLIVLKWEDLPWKYCAAVDPLSTAGAFPYTVSVATGSFRRETLRAGLGARICLLNLVPFTAPRLPYWVVAAKVRLITSSELPGKYSKYLEKGIGLGTVLLGPFGLPCASLVFAGLL